MSSGDGIAPIRAVVEELVVGTKPMTPDIEPHIEIASSLRSSQ
jgi:hypothetical protein